MSPQNGPSLTASVVQAIELIALPFVLFSGVFCGILTASSVTLLPSLTQIEINGELRDATALQSYHINLTASILQAEDTRKTFVDPLSSSLYASLIEKKRHQLHPLTLRNAIDQLAGELHATQDVVHVHAFSVKRNPDHVRIRGDIRNAGPRSMTLLAQFVEELEQLEFVQTVSKPVFEKVHNETIGFHSPFDITLTLTSNESHIISDSAPANRSRSEGWTQRLSEHTSIHSKQNQQLTTKKQENKSPTTSTTSHMPSYPSATT